MLIFVQKYVLTKGITHCQQVACKVGDVVGVKLKISRRLDNLGVVGNDDHEDLHGQPANEEDYQHGHQKTKYLRKCKIFGLNVRKFNKKA